MIELYPNIYHKEIRLSLGEAYRLGQQEYGWYSWCLLECNLNSVLV